jgi:hypothetical protein
MFSTVQAFLDNGSQCWARLKLGNGDPCWISVAQSGVIVKRSRLGLFGATLYKETDVYKAAMTAKALSFLLTSNLLPKGFSNPVLSAFTNTAMGCMSAAEVVRALGSAIAVAEHRTGTPISEISVTPL